MAFIAWFSLIAYALAMLTGNFVNVKRGKPFGLFMIDVTIQSCILWCLIYLIILL